MSTGIRGKSAPNNFADHGTRCRNRSILKLSARFCAMSVVVLLSFAAGEPGGKIDLELLTREQMVTISRQLGVTCSHCHSLENFKDGRLRNFQVAKEHMRVVTMINDQPTFKGKSKADCYMCHRGLAVPEYKEKPDAKDKSKNH